MRAMQKEVREERGKRLSQELLPFDDAGHVDGPGGERESVGRLLKDSERRFRSYKCRRGQREAHAAGQ